MVITVKTSTGKYDITLEKGAINNLTNAVDLKKRALIVTDSGVPKQYAEVVSKQFENSEITIIPEGEQSKSFETYVQLLSALADGNFDRTSCVVAVGGGVVGDISGFAAATYMRGITFINIPTTLLSQVDSSIGGKTAIDFKNYKNIVGAFYQPAAVIIDPVVLQTLSNRQFSNGLAESIKMAATSDEQLFSLLEENDAHDIIETVIERSLLIKKKVVEADEKEIGLRMVLNFGHTLAHAVETSAGLGTLYHGECVSIGMLPMCSENAKKRIAALLIKNNLPIKADVSLSDVKNAVRHDKKTAGDSINTVYVDEIGSFEFRKTSFCELDNMLKGAL